jgi:hypothetical protein
MFSTAPEVAIRLARIISDTCVLADYSRFWWNSLEGHSVVKLWNDSWIRFLISVEHLISAVHLFVPNSSTFGIYYRHCRPNFASLIIFVGSVRMVAIPLAGLIRVAIRLLCAILLCLLWTFCRNRVKCCWGLSGYLGEKVRFSLSLSLHLHFESGRLVVKQELCVNVIAAIRSDLARPNQLAAVPEGQTKYREVYSA